MACRESALPPLWWHDAELLKAEVEAHRSFAATGRVHSVASSTLKSAWSQHRLPPHRAGGLSPVTNPEPLNEPLLRLAESTAKPRKRPEVKGERLPVNGLERIFFMGDLHCPYHDRAALGLWLKACRDFKPTIVVSTGDFMDCFAVSSYSKDPRRAFGLDEEIDQGRAVLDRIEEASPGARRIYIAGNHEDRLQRYLQDKAPQLFNLIDIGKLLELDSRGWEYTPYKQATKIGKLNLTHDVGTAGRYAAYRALEAFQSPVVTGHTHRMSYVVEGDADGKTQVSAQFGWLGDAEQVDYMHRVQAKKNWPLGFGYGYLNPKTGYVYLVPVPVVNYTAVVEGRLYEARPKRMRAAA